MPRLLLAAMSALCLAGTAMAQQVSDPNFDAKVARPAYLEKHPRVLFDAAHFNFHTAEGRYKPFADLLRNDGYTVVSNEKKFSPQTLEGFDVLVIVNALGAERQNLPGADQPAFTEEECDAVRDWVRAGGALLLVADHAPFGAATERLAARFGVEMHKGHTFDPQNHDPEIGNLSFLLFSRENKLLGDHPITRGRDAAEQVKRVATFTGQSLKGPEGSVAFLRLGDSAMDRQRPAGGEAEGQSLDRLSDGTPLPPGARVRVGGMRGATPAAGRAQGIALEFGRGRVVVLGEAAMLTAQLVRGPGAQLLGVEEFAMGMNRPGNDNRQLALNILHWLSRLLE